MGEVFDDPNGVSGEIGIQGHTNCVRGTADGAFITFFTTGRLTADDPDESSGDIYTYDAEADERGPHPPRHLEDDVARELARINLPLSLYTEMYWQIDLNNLFHFLRLRMDWHAQYEIRVYGDAMAQVAQAVCPLAYQAFEEHVLHGRNFARSEIELLRSALDRDKLVAALEASGMRASRRREFLDKLGLEG